MLLSFFLSLLLLRVGFAAGTYHGSAGGHQHHHALGHSHHLDRRSFQNTTSREAAPTASRYWYADPGLRHGTWKNSIFSGSAFRNVRDYGAKGDGVTDDTAAIARAIETGGRCSPRANCTSSTRSNVVVYFPPGTYIISHPIVIFYATLLAGDPTNLPTIKASANFANQFIDSDLLVLIDSNPYNKGRLWFPTTDTFFQQIRNLRLDTTAVPAAEKMLALHWQNSQACSLQNLEIILSNGKNTQHTGIRTDEGSGGFASDLTIRNGNIGWQVGSQQFTARNLTFIDQVKAVSMAWDWGFLWKSINVIGAQTAFSLESYDPGNKQGIGSVSIMDSTFSNSAQGIMMNRNVPLEGRPGVILENLKVTNGTNIAAWSGAQPLPILMANKGKDASTTVSMWGIGNEISGRQSKLLNTPGKTFTRPKYTKGLLTPSGAVFERSKPRYDTYTKDQVLNVYDYGVRSNGSDMTAFINKALIDGAAAGKLVFFPHGRYMVANNIFVPVGSRIVGEAWSQIVAMGPAFADEKAPRVMVTVGHAGEKGIVEISDMLFTVQGALAGAILLQWNVKESIQGSAAMWDCHFRIGGAEESQLTASDCPITELDDGKCRAVSLAFHITPHSSGYFENIWVWTADHDLDTPTGKPDLQIISGRGILIESQGPTWLYGVSAEHFALYQTTLLNAQNVFIGMLQTESPYYQPRFLPTRSIKNVGQFPGDPGFEECTDLLGVGGISVSEKGTASWHQRALCERAWGLSIINSQDIFANGLGLYSFYTDYQKCSDPPNIKENSGPGATTQSTVNQALNNLLKSPLGPLIGQLSGIVQTAGGLPNSIGQLLGGQGLDALGQLVTNILAPPRPPPLIPEASSPQSLEIPRLPPTLIQPLIAGALAVLQSSWSRAAEAGICQDRIFELANSDRIWAYNVFVTGVREAVSPQGFPGTPLNASLRRGYTGEIVAFLSLSGEGDAFRGKGLDFRERWVGNMYDEGGDTTVADEVGGRS